MEPVKGEIRGRADDADVDSVAMTLPDGAKELIRSGARGHLVTAHLNPRLRKLENVRRDPRVALSFEETEIQPPGLRQYVVVHGRATIEEGGAPELLQELARVYLGPEVKFPPVADPPPGVRLRIGVERVGGIGPWAE
jgi:Pyridoxamine 5'-phosphate oxidase